MDSNNLDDDQVLDFEVNSEDENSRELELIKAQVKEMEEEAEKIKQLQDEFDKQQQQVDSTDTSGTGKQPSFQDKQEIDSRSVYVGNVDYSVTAEELESHFHGCGVINRVTILCNKFDGHPKGFAYVEFGSKNSVNIALQMDKSYLKGRQIKVMSKRTNLPGISTTNRYPAAFTGRKMSRGGGHFPATGYRNQFKPTYQKRFSVFRPY